MGDLLNPDVLPLFHLMPRRWRLAHLEYHEPGLSVGRRWSRPQQIDAHRDQHDRWGWGHKHDSDDG
jgi:hypothetical protein